MQKVIGHYSKGLSIKKIPLIPPFFHRNDYVTDFKKKAELFHSFLRNNVL